MTGFTTTSNDYLIRSNLWSTQLKEVLRDQLIGTKYVNLLTDFPDGDTFNIPSIGQSEVFDYLEGQQVQYSDMSTGNFTFTIAAYKSAATYITNKMKQDSYLMSQLVAKFVPEQSMALMRALEADMLAAPVTGQTNASTNTINGAYHRFIGSGLNETISIEDFARASYALRQANVPMTNLVAIVDPSVAHTLGTLPNVMNLASLNPRWEKVVTDGYMTGMNFVMNVYGFDVYTSQYLKVNTASETINSVTAAAGVNNLFFSADSSVLPIVGAIRQAPRVDSEYNKDWQRDEYITTMRYGFKLYRPENMVCVVCDTDQVYA
jgi:hypothetical protein